MPPVEYKVADDSVDQHDKDPDSGPQTDLFSNSVDTELDALLPRLPASGALKSAESELPQTANELLSAFAEHGVRAYRRMGAARNLPIVMKREQRPEMAWMTEISRAAAAQLDIPIKLVEDAVKVALNKLRETEIHTELTTHVRRDESVQIVTDRNALAREALARLRELPQVEDEDCKVIAEVLMNRMLPPVREALDDLNSDSMPDELATLHFARDAAYWVVLRQVDQLAEAMYDAIAAKAETVDAGPLPDAMLFPAALPLAASTKNIYGALPPSAESLSNIEQVLLLDERALLASRTWAIGTDVFFTDRYDGGSSMNGEELAFAKALDRADFVTWWHRNPDRKPYSVRLVRGEHRNYFHPDFVVCLEHYPGDEPLIRLIETKENVKDAMRKAKHVPTYYGKVLFLTKDEKRLRWVNDDGSLGGNIDLEDLTEVREWLRGSRPTQAP
jgi:hypothetical protein